MVMGPLEALVIMLAFCAAGAIVGRAGLQRAAGRPVRHWLTM